MSEQFTVEGFTFSELPEEVQARITARHWSVTEGPDFTEWRESAQAFADRLGCPTGRGYLAYEASTYRDEHWGDLSGVRAWKWLLNNGWFAFAEENSAGSCLLTGVSTDCPLTDPIKALANNPAGVPELSQLFYECTQGQMIAYGKEADYYVSGEYAAEMLAEDDTFYTADGQELTPAEIFKREEG